MDLPSTSTLPSTAEFIGRLITQLSEYNNKDNHDHRLPTSTTRHRPSQSQNQNQNPLSSLSSPQLSKIKPLMLTLHCLFPNELLLALDILDRRLVRRFVRVDAALNNNLATSAAVNGETMMTIPQQTSQEETFFVISASSGPPPFTTTYSSRGQKGYEVRLHAWNCTCPAFTISAFQQDLGPIPERGVDSSPGDYFDYFDHYYSLQNQEEGGYYCYPFGGDLTLKSARSSPPVCKHLLACILAVRCPALFGPGVEEHAVSAGELGGWCAGWAGWFQVQIAFMKKPSVYLIKNPFSKWESTVTKPVTDRGISSKVREDSCALGYHFLFVIISRNWGVQLPFYMHAKKAITLHGQHSHNQLEM